MPDAARWAEIARCPAAGEPRTASAWQPARFFRAVPGGDPVEAHGYEWRGLALRHSGWAAPRTETRWAMIHLGSGGTIARFVGDVATVMPVAGEIASCGDWTLFDLPDGWRQTDPELPEKVAAILAAHPEARPEGDWPDGRVSDADARAVIAAREAPPAEDDPLARLQREREADEARFRATILAAGRADVLAEYDARMEDVRSGRRQARATWDALSPAQRRVLLFLAPGRALVRCGWSRNFYDAVCATGAWPGLSTIAKAARLDTVRNLVSRGLLDLDGTAHDPERRAVLSDRGRFVLAHGQKGTQDAR